MNIKKTGLLYQLATFKFFNDYSFVASRNGCSFFWQVVRGLGSATVHTLMGFGAVALLIDLITYSGLYIDYLKSLGETLLGVVLLVPYALSAILGLGCILLLTLCGGMYVLTEVLPNAISKKLAGSALAGNTKEVYRAVKDNYCPIIDFKD